MALRMPSPTKHQKTHVYYLNVRVPADLVRAGRRPVVKESLRTKDPVTAKRLFALRYEELHGNGKQSVMVLRLSRWPG